MFILGEPCKACPLLDFADPNGRKYVSDCKKTTPCGDPNHNILTSDVGATYQVARVPATNDRIITLKRTDGTLFRQYRTSLVGAIYQIARRSPENQGAQAADAVEFQ
ncbi:MAG: hypothetical protein OXG39_11765 [Chloroflexi bacterium]|nr:hypothetical protein [Chloroflexota bacterium]